MNVSHAGAKASGTRETLPDDGCQIRRLRLARPAVATSPADAATATTSWCAGSAGSGSLRRTPNASHMDTVPSWSANTTRPASKQTATIRLWPLACRRSGAGAMLCHQTPQVRLGEGHPQHGAATAFEQCTVRFPGCRVAQPGLCRWRRRRRARCDNRGPWPARGNLQVRAGQPGNRQRARHPGSKAMRTGRDDERLRGDRRAQPVRHGDEAQREVARNKDATWARA